jgi:1,4-dihydroxy-2-naphthoate octaprenyltransferase
MSSAAPSTAAVKIAAVPNRRLLVALALLAGVVLVVIAAIYWAEPAKSLPSFFPGHQAGSNHHHVKHGIAAFLVGLACFVFAWFNTGGGRTRASAA